jgi:hypothetical protein
MKTNQTPVMVKVEDLIPNPLNFYKSSELDKLAMADSIRERGVKTAIVAKPDKDNPGKFIIISGHLRVTGSIMAGLHEVPCIIEEYDTEEEELNALVIGNEYRTKTKFEVASEMNARKRIWAKGQGERSDLYSPEGERPLSTRARLALRFKMAEAQVGKYEHIFDTRPSLYKYIDRGNMSIDGANNLLRFLDTQAISEPNDVKMQEAVVELRAPKQLEKVRQNKLVLEEVFFHVVKGLANMNKPKTRQESQPSNDEKELAKKVVKPEKSNTPAPDEESDEKNEDNKESEEAPETENQKEPEEEDARTFVCTTARCECYGMTLRIMEEEDENINEEDSQE